MTVVAPLDFFFVPARRRSINDRIGAIITLVYGSALLGFGRRGFTASNYDLAFTFLPPRAWGGIFVSVAAAALVAARKSTVMAAAATCALLIGLWAAWEMLVVISIGEDLIDSSPNRLVLATPILTAGLITTMWFSLLRYGVTRPRRRE